MLQLSLKRPLRDYSQVVGWYLVSRQLGPAIANLPGVGFG